MVVSIWRKKYLSSLIYIYNAQDRKSITDLARAIDSGHNYASNIVFNLSRSGFVSCESVGRCKFVSLTPKGVVVAKSLTLIRNVL